MKGLSLRARRMAATVALAAAATTALGAASAGATTARDGCSVTPHRPIYVYHDSTGTKVIRYGVTATCTGGRWLQLYQQRKESDTFSDDNTGSQYLGWYYFSGNATRYYYVDARLPDTEWGNEEMYQRLQFRVYSNGVYGSWTGGENSAIQSFSN